MNAVVRFLMSRRARRVMVAGVAAMVVAFALVAAWIAWPLPRGLLDVGAQGLTITDRRGLTLRSTRAGDGSRTQWVPYDQLDVDLATAFIAIEDQRFWEHHGVDFPAVARAAKDNLRSFRIVSGASTITMQLARLLHPASRTWDGKVQQALWALRLERHLSKQQILEQYLNRIELGQGTIGVSAATAFYFGTSPTDVSLSQAATLAGLAHAPSRANPFVSAARATRRRDRVLARMQALGVASAADVDRARAEPLPTTPRSVPFKAPHFTSRVLAWLVDSNATKRISVVSTSLDLDLQTELEAEVRHTVDMLRTRGVEDAAAVVLDNTTGEVLAWVGSPDFWAPKDGQTDMVVSLRQPGSALKPFLYGLALDRGYTAATILPDLPKAFASPTGAYTPRNYDRRFRGPVRVREALASSYNVPAVEMASRVGTGALLHTLRLAGFTTLDHDAEYYGLGLALGNGDVRLIELANAYRALANGGEWRPWTWRPSPIRAGAARDDGQRVVSPMSSAIVLNMLSDADARIPAFGLETPFDFPFPVAVKTGTSRHFTDNWAVGTTRGFTVAVWAGNFSGRSMEGVSGITGAGPLLHRAIMATARRVQPGQLTTPAELGAVNVRVCRLSGLLATDGCAQMNEWFAPGTAPTRADDWEQGGRVTLPAEYADWVAQGAGPVAATMALSPASETVSLPLANPLVNANADSGNTRTRRFTILSPQDGDRYAIPSGIDARYATIPLRAGGPGGQPVAWTIDGHPFTGERWSLVPGTHVIEAQSPTGSRAEARIVVDPPIPTTSPLIPHP